MTYITLERLIFLTPSIEKIIASKANEHLCFSRISQTRSYLKCCYISLNNFLIELLEITDHQKADRLVFYNAAHDHSITHCVSIGLRTDNLDAALNSLSNQHIHPTELYDSKDPKYSKGYKHRTACLNVHWFDKMVYLSEYDNEFFELRKNDIVTDVEKMQCYSIPETQVKPNNFCAPNFITFTNGIPRINVNTLHDMTPSFECDWLILSPISFKTRV